MFVRLVMAATVVCLPVLGAAADQAASHDSGVHSFLESAEAVVRGAAEAPPAPEEPVVGDPEVLTAARCVDLALAHNAQAFIAEAKLAAAHALTGQAAAARRPQAAARLIYTYADGLETDLGGAGFLTDLMGGSDLLGSKDTRTLEFSFTQVLYAGGQIAAAVRASRHLAQSEQWRREAALDTLEFEAKQAYYACLLAHALVRVAQDSVVTFERHLADAQQGFEVGSIGGFEVLRAKTELGARQSDLIAAKNAERLARVNLRRLLVIPQHTPLRFEGKLAWEPRDTAVADLVEQALANRPELRALEQAVAAARADVRGRQAQYRPKVAATAQWSYVDGAGSVFPDGWTLGLGVEWDLYAGGRRKHEVAAARAELECLEYECEDVQRLVEMDVRQADILVQDAIATIRREKGNVELGREGRRLAMLRFHEGVGTQAETLDAELALTKAETSLVQALRDYAVAQAALDRALGAGAARRAAQASAG